MTSCARPGARAFDRACLALGKERSFLNMPDDFEWRDCGCATGFPHRRLCVHAAPRPAAEATAERAAQARRRKRRHGGHTARAGDDGVAASRAARRAAEPGGANAAADEGGDCRPRRERRSNIRLRGYAEHHRGESSESGESSDGDDDDDDDDGPPATQRPRKKRARCEADDVVPPPDIGAARAARAVRAAERIAPFVRALARHLRQSPAADGRRRRAHACEVRRLCDGPDAPWVRCATQSEAAAMIGVTAPTVSHHLNCTHDTRVPGLHDAIHGWRCRKPPRAHGDGDSSGENGGDIPATAEESQGRRGLGGAIAIGALATHEPTAFASCAVGGADNANSEADANSAALPTMPFGRPLAAATAGSGAKPAAGGGSHHSRAARLTEVRRVADGPGAPWVRFASQIQAAAKIGVTQRSLNSYLNRKRKAVVPGVDPINGWLCRKAIDDGGGPGGATVVDGAATATRETSLEPEADNSAKSRFSG